MATKTGLQMNWSSVTVTPPTPAAAITLDGITDLSLSAAARQEIFFGDARRHPRLVRNVEEMRKGKVVGANIALLQAIPRGVPCTVVAVLNDAVNGSGSGALSVTWTGAVFANLTEHGTNNKVALGDIDFTCQGDAADAEPFTVSQAS